MTEERVEEVTVRLRGGDGVGSAEMSTYYVKIITASIKHINLLQWFFQTYWYQKH